MILIDVGNTRIHYCQLKNGRIGDVTSSLTEAASIRRIIPILARYKSRDVLVCSVVPAVTRLFREIKQHGYSSIVAGIDTPIPMPCHYHRKEIGADRLIGALGALSINRKTRLIIDCGSATTFDILTENGEYDGGFILPGLASALRGLCACALLPDTITLKPLVKKTTTIPHRTTESIQRGVIEGFAAMLNELTHKYTRALKIPASIPVIITGGDSKIIAPQLTFRYRYDPHLVFKGLAVIAAKSR